MKHQSKFQLFSVKINFIRLPFLTPRLSGFEIVNEIFKNSSVSRLFYKHFLCFVITIYVNIIF